MLDRDVFLSAIELSGDARRAFLDQACGNNPELRRKVEALFAAHEQAGNFLAKPAVEATRAFTPGEEGDVPSRNVAEMDHMPGKVLAGRYKLLERIGQGGMGSVYVAEQSQPVRRKVAIKIIKLGMNTGQVLARFEAERQALALMDHPNIAKVLDGGMTEDHRPFFVMEYVKGDPMNEFCDKEQLTVKQRLDLFILVCQAVQHAHQKGIIHRDLKPGNILVCLYDGKPVPKVIDFGLAKALHQPLTDHTLYTGHGMVLGTPLYMSPEQAEVNNFDVDTRTDIYALGVILYELLTGTTPLEKQRFKKAAWDEVLRIIREEEPPKPSTKLSGSNQLASLSAQRKLEPRKLTQLLTGELDWIVMKALEKDRNRRYETANGFSRDIQRYLADEVVEARPPSTGYRLRKFVQRNKGKVIAASLVLLTLVAGVTGTTIGLFRASTEAANARAAEGKEREAAELARTREEEARAAEAKAVEREREERKAKEQEKKARETAEAVATFMQDVFAQGSAAGQASPTREVKRDLTVKAAMDYAAKAIAGRFKDRPDIEAAVRNTIGKTYFELAAYPEAEREWTKSQALREKIFGQDHSETLQSVNNLAVMYRERGDLAAAEPLFKRALAGSEKVLGPDHPHTIVSINNLAHLYFSRADYAAAEQLLKRALAGGEKTLGPDHPDTLRSVIALGALYREKGDYPAAEPLFKRALAGFEKALGQDHPETLRSVSDLASLYLNKGDYPATESLFKRALAGQEKALGPDHSETLRSAERLAWLYSQKADYAAAEPLFKRALAGFEKALVPDHPYTLSCVSNLGSMYCLMHEYASAEPLLKRALAGNEKAYGPDHPYTLTSAYNLAVLYRNMEDYAAAEPLYKRALAGQEKQLGPNHPSTLTSANGLAALYASTHRLREAILIQEDILRRNRKVLGEDHPSTLTTLGNLGVSYLEIGRVGEAVPLLELAYRRDPTRGLDLMNAYVESGKYAEAKKLIDELLAEARQTLPKESPQLAGQLAQYGFSLLKMKRYAEADPLLRECLSIREKTQPDLWSTFNMQSILGGALLGQKKYTDAEPLLLKGYEGMKAREKSIPKTGGGDLRLPEALDRLIQFYTETNKPDEVKKWQAEKAKISTTSEKK